MSPLAAIIVMAFAAAALIALAVRAAFSVVRGFDPPERDEDITTWT